MAEFKLGRIRFVWKSDWITSTTYYKDDVISYGGKTFLCVVGHSAAADFYTDLNNIPSKWNQFSDGQDWKGDWQDDFTYKVNDIIKYGGLLYIANAGHTSGLTLEADQSKWDLLAESFNWTASWGTNTTYKVNDLVKYGGHVYLCTQAHTSALTAALGLEADQAKWDEFSVGVDWKGDWTVNTRFKVGDIVKYGGTTYVCNLHHTSALTTALGLEADQAKWDYYNQGFEYKGTWTTAGAVRYKINDVVKYGSGTWICTTAHTQTTSFVTDQTNWAQFVEGIEYENDWATATVYQHGDIVKYGGNSYIAKTTHLSTSSPPVDSTNYNLFTEGFKFFGDWNSSTTFKVGEVVRLNGYTYVAVGNNTNQSPPNATFWSLLNQGIQWRSNWVNARAYKLGDAVKYGPNSYIAIQAHTSSTGSDRPDNDISGIYWNLLAAGNEESVLTTSGDLVIYGGAGPTRLPIGDTGQVLTVSADNLPAWEYWGRVAKVFYVAPHGVNSPAPTYGLTIDQPWASIRYACDQIEKGYQNQDAGWLLAQNRTFIQKEIVEWTDYQITNNIAPFTSAFTYNKETCQRDMGLLVDAIAYDLTHTGNSKAIEAAQRYFTALGVSYITGQTAQTVASINYGVSLIGSVLAQTAPSVNYQGANGITLANRILQVTSINYTAETGTAGTAATLASIVTSAITAGNLTGLPTLDLPTYTLNVKTGQYYEVLPIIVPALTAVVGDELRGSRVSPAAKIIADNDKAKSVAAYQRLQTVSQNIVINATVTPSSGNTETQNKTAQNEGDAGSTTAISRVTALSAEIKDILTNGEAAAAAFSTPDPTGYNTSYLTGYGDARAQLTANTAFIKAEITGWIFDNYSTTVTASSAVDNSITVSSTSWMAVNMPIRFAASGGGVLAGVTYYVQSIISGIKFTVGATRNTIDAIPLTTASFSTTVQFYYISATCERDVGHIIDALKYDLTYGGNYQTRVAADAYFSYGVGTYGVGEGAVTLAAYTRMKFIVNAVILETAITRTPSNTAVQNTAGTPGSAGSATFGSARMQDIIDTLTNSGTLPALIAPSLSWVSTELQTARTRLVSARSTIQSDAVEYVKREFPTLSFNYTTCSRDVGYIVDALGYDLAFNSNFASVKAGLAYRRGTSSAQLVVANQLAATQSILDFISKKASFIAASGAQALIDLIWTDLIAYVNTGTAPLIIGTNTPDINLNLINGAKILELNKEFLVAESTAYIDLTNNSTVTAADTTTDRFTVPSTSWMVAGDKIRFVGTMFGGVVSGTDYFVKQVISGTQFTVSDTLGGAVRNLITASGTMTVIYSYDSAKCQRDVRETIDAIVRDMIYVGNYSSTNAAKYYRNALTGSKLENMFLVRNGCGARNMTLTGLDGSSDGNVTGYQAALLPANAFGTRRPRAGAYVSLDPGWGPNDSRVWVTTRSTYVQNVTTFGIGCIGQKIDGSLHSGGNDSIVSNDFTQVLSDGIGAWVTNLGRAELVSVFSYYNYIGYLAENGGKIRATNGNNSYGTYGAIAEGVDVTETPVTGQINNRNTEADIVDVITDGTKVLLLEFGNAGSTYTSATFNIAGAGSGVSTLGNETRDGGVFNVRLTDPGDSSGTGGVGYITAGNQGQTGSTTSITLAASDIQGSDVYVGMSIYLTAGLGAGQYGYIGTYNSASKIATVLKESTGTAGWDHVVAGTTIVAPDVTTTYSITPRITFTAPNYTQAKANMPASRDWSDVVWGNGRGSYAAVNATGGTGSFASFDVSRVDGVYTVALYAGGTLYAAGQTLTIAGTSLGGTSPANDLIITISSVTSPSGGVVTFTYVGNAVTPRFVAVAKDSLTGAVSSNGIDWTDITLPGSATQWAAIAYGVVSNVGYFVAVARESSQAAWSTNGLNWNLANMGDTVDWCDIAYGNGTFVAIAESDSSTAFRAVSTNGGTTWAFNTVATGAKAIAYGGGKFVIVEGNFSNSFAYSVNGSVWTVGTLPSNNDSTESNWVDIAYGNNRFVAISDSSAMAAYSLDGITFVKSNMPTTAEWSTVDYGQGVFNAMSYGESSATSPDGVTWTARSGIYQPIDITVTAKDTNAGYVARTLPTVSYWTDVIWTGTKFVAVGHDNGAVGAAVAASSTTGESWTPVTLGVVSGQYEYSALSYNGTTYVAILTNTRHVSTSSDGVTWAGTVNAIPGSASQWSDIANNGTRFVAISASANRTAYSTDGVTWTNGTISAAATEYTSIANGSIGGVNRFVITSGLTSASQVSAFSLDGITWTANATGFPSAQLWSSVAYGNSRFVAVSGNTATTSTAAAYSTDGSTWLAATMPGAAARWNKVIYGGGAFTAFAYNSTRTAYSTNGVTWVEGPALTATANWYAGAYGNSRNVVLATAGSSAAQSNNFVLDTNLLTTSSSTTNLNVNDRLIFQRDSTGAEIFGGVRFEDTTYYVTSIANSTQFTISTTRGGSNFVLTNSTGSMLATVSKNYTTSALGNYLGTPQWVVLASGSQGLLRISQGARARGRATVVANTISSIKIHEPGSGYTTAPTVSITDPNNTGADATTQVRIGNGALAQPTFISRGTSYSAASAEIVGDGYADNYQVSSFIGIKNLSAIPRNGSSFRVVGIDDVYYRVVNVTNLTGQAAPYTATIQISPAFGAAETPEHETNVTMRIRYSQVRLTGHDFLDIGTGNQADTNYPNLPVYDPIPANETVDTNGGRVFYTSTDQDGNFRVGGLFNVEQSTGVATLNADAFNIAGLNELSLGSVALGGAGATINEFSTDPFFTADSDSVVPTQRAIKAYITSQIGGGGSSLNVNTLTAGVIYIAGQTISTTTNVAININTKVNFKGGIAGDALVLNYFLLNN